MHAVTQLILRFYWYYLSRNYECRISSQLGSGQFGEVCRAKWSISGTTKDLAIKTLKVDSKEEEKIRFLQEAAIMGQFSHPNVVRLYGVVTVGNPVSIASTNLQRSKKCIQTFPLLILTR